MSILGIQRLVYGVDDLAECTRFFDDFGLPLVSQSDEQSCFKLEEGSEVHIYELNHPAIPKSAVVGTGVREAIWAVDTQAALDELIEDLKTDREVRIDEEGIAHFLSDCGLPLGLGVLARNKVVNAPDQLNSPGVVNRLNTHRKWRRRAHPKTIQHVVFAVEDFHKSYAFFEKRLKFRLSDYQHNFGIYSRADGNNSHHNLFLLNASLPFPGLDGQPRFHHANFGVEDVDEIMVGANYMKRKGWPESYLGLGRHRVDSALFFYLPCPTGGEAEYGTDGDFLDDRWVPREWPVPLFGFSHFTHNLPEWLIEEPEWTFTYMDRTKMFPSSK